MKGENLLHIYKQMLYCILNITNKTNSYKNDLIHRQNIYMQFYFY